MPVAVKICGLRTENTLTAALDGGADYVGLVLYGPSPRNVDLATAGRLASRARGLAAVVALLVDPTDRHIGDVLEHVSPDILQLHGDETPDRVAEIRNLSGRRIMKAIKVETAEDARMALDFENFADLILFDAKAPKSMAGALPGGNAVTFDWRTLEGVKGGIGDWMLAGGLTPDNVAEAIRLTGAPAVDVSSGVESRPGEKSAELIRRFLAAAKAANPNP